MHGRRCDRRPTLVQRFIALGFALGSVAVVSMTVELMVTGPLGDPDGGLAQELGVGDLYALAWSVVCRRRRRATTSSPRRRPRRPPS